MNFKAQDEYYILDTEHKMTHKGTLKKFAVSEQKAINQIIVE